jgi:raffinose/stachyose/melibiose transport system substrate-binding protein
MPEMMNTPIRRRLGKRRSALLLLSAASVTALALTSCSGGAPDSSASEGADVELTFLNQSRGQEAALTQLAEQYTEETGVKITIDSPGPADYLPKLQAASQSNSMPDIYSSFLATDMAPYYKAGWAMELSSELEGGWSEDFSPQVVEMSTFQEGNNLGVDPGVYSVHWETQTMGMLVNPALTDFTADDAPETWSDFIEALEDANASGDGTFTVAASVTPNLVQGLASNWLTDEEISATFDGESSWETDAWRDVFQTFVDLKDAGVITNNALPGGQDDNPNVETEFFTQGVATIFDASPGVSVGLRTNPEFEDYFSIAVPAADDGDLDARSPGQPGKGAVINPKGDHPEESLEFAKWLTKPAQQQVFAEVGRILPSNPELLSGGDVPPQLAGYAAAVENMQVISTTFTPDVRAAIVAEIQRLVLGEITVDDLLASVQAAQDRSA